MSQTQASLPPIRSARPAVTQEVMERTALSEAVLTDLVHRFYDKVRLDPVLGPIFADRIGDWEPHLEKMVDFWSSVALMTGRYHGSPVAKHEGLPLIWQHFERWLDLFRQTAREVCTHEGATHVVARAERIAHSLHLACLSAQDRSGSLGCSSFFESD